MADLYEEKLIGARDVCSNCFRLRLVERVEVRSRGMAASPETESTYTRRKRTTTLDHHPADPPASDKHLFCNCGVSNARTRIWDPSDVERDRFKELIKGAVQSLEYKGVSLKRNETVMYALHHFDEHEDVDRALATAIDLGVVAEAASGGTAGT